MTLEERNFALVKRREMVWSVDGTLESGQV